MKIKIKDRLWERQRGTQCNCLISNVTIQEWQQLRTRLQSQLYTNWVRATVLWHIYIILLNLVCPSGTMWIRPIYTRIWHFWAWSATIPPQRASAVMKPHSLLTPWYVTIMNLELLLGMAYVFGYKHPVSGRNLATSRYKASRPPCVWYAFAKVEYSPKIWLKHVGIKDLHLIYAFLFQV